MVLGQKGKGARHYKYTTPGKPHILLMIRRVTTNYRASKGGPAGSSLE